VNTCTALMAVTLSKIIRKCMHNINSCSLLTVFLPVDFPFMNANLLMQMAVTVGSCSLT